MPLTATLTDYRRNLTSITNKVMNDGISVTVIKNSKPIFKVVPIAAANEASRMHDAYLVAAEELDDEYFDVFEALGR